MATVAVQAQTGGVTLTPQQATPAEELLTLSANIISTFAQQGQPANDGERTLQSMAQGCTTQLGLGAATTVIGFIGGVKSVVEAESQAKSIDSVCTLVKNCTTTEALTDIVNNHDTKLKFLDKLWKKINGTSTEQMRKDLEKIHAADLENFKSKYWAELQLAKKEMANKSMNLAVLSAFAVVVSQTIQLIAVWKDIQDSNNLIDDQVEKARVRAQLDRLIQELTTLETTVQTWKELPNGRSKEKAFLKIQREINKVQRIQQETKSSIENIKFNINGQIKKLKDHQTTLAVNTVSGILHFIITSVQLGTSFNLLGTATKILGIIAPIALGVVQVANVGMVVMTEKKMTALRRVLQEYGLLDLELTNLTNRLTDIQTWADEQNFDDM